jgi:hypothetical protein
MLLQAFRDSLKLHRSLKCAFSNPSHITPLLALSHQWGRIVKSPPAERDPEEDAKEQEKWKIEREHRLQLKRKIFPKKGAPAKVAVSKEAKGGAKEAKGPQRWEGDAWQKRSGQEGSKSAR